jgi:hypothetical protein
VRPVAPPAIPRSSATIFLKNVEVGINRPGQGGAREAPPYDRDYGPHKPASALRVCLARARHHCRVSWFAVGRPAHGLALFRAPWRLYPVYQCRADQQQHGGPRCQEVRALPVDAAVESLAPPGCARVGPSVSPAARHPGRSPGSFGEGPRVRGLTAGGSRIRTRGPALRRAPLTRPRYTESESFGRRERHHSGGNQKLESASFGG